MEYIYITDAPQSIKWWHAVPSGTFSGLFHLSVILAVLVGIVSGPLARNRPTESTERPRYAKAFREIEGDSLV